MQRYKARKSTLTADEAAHWETRYQIGAMFYAAALGIWCFIALLEQRRCRCPHDLSVRHHRLHGGRRGQDLGRPWIFQLQVLLRLRADVARAGAAWQTLLHRHVVVLRALFFVALKQIIASLHRIFVQALVGARARGGACGPVRHRAEQHAARPVHVRRRRASCGHESSFQRDDEPVGRSRASRRECTRHRRRLRRAPDRSRLRAAKIILAEIENSQARDIITTDPDVVRGRSLSWTFQPMAGGGAVVLLEDITERRNAEARITPSGALRRTDGASQPGQFPRRDRAPSGGAA